MPITKSRKPAAKKTAAPATTPAAKSKATAKPAAKPVAKKVAAKPTAKKATASTKAPAAKPATKRTINRVFDKGPHGFVKGTDQAKIADLLIKGGAGRADIVEKAKATLDTESRNGTPKPISTMVNNVARKLADQGYEIKETIKAVKPKP